MQGDRHWDKHEALPRTVLFGTTWLQRNQAGL